MIQSVTRRSPSTTRSCSLQSSRPCKSASKRFVCTARSHDAPLIGDDHGWNLKTAHGPTAFASSLSHLSLAKIYSKALRLPVWHSNGNAQDSMQRRACSKDCAAVVAGDASHMRGPYTGKPLHSCALPHVAKSASACQHDRCNKESNLHLAPVDKAYFAIVCISHHALKQFAIVTILSSI